MPTCLQSLILASSSVRDLMDDALWIFMWVFILCCDEWRTFQTSKVILSTKCKCTCEVMKLGSFTRTRKTPQTQGPTMYTSATVCSLCIVELQQRHSQLVNGAITSNNNNNNMSYLTKTLSLCHWMCFMSNNKKNCFVRLVLYFFFSYLSATSCCYKKENGIFPPAGVSVSALCVCWGGLRCHTSVLRFSQIFTSNKIRYFFTWTNR